MVDSDVAFDVDTFEVLVVDVGPGGHAGSATKCLVGIDGQFGHADRAEAAGRRTEGRFDLVGVGRHHFGGSGGIDELLLQERMVAPQQDQREHAVDVVDERLDLVDRRMVEFDECCDGPHARRRKALRSVAGRAVIHGFERRSGPLHIGGVSASVTDRHVVLAGIGLDHELDRGAAAHGARRGLHRTGI